MDEDVVQLVICLPDLAETVTKNELVRHITCECLLGPEYTYAYHQSLGVSLLERKWLLQQRK
jgi:hypothetical protein